jgi:hypothetical protein
MEKEVLEKKGWLRSNCLKPLADSKIYISWPVHPEVVQVPIYNQNKKNPIK